MKKEIERKDYKYYKLKSKDDIKASFKHGYNVGYRQGLEVACAFIKDEDIRNKIKEKAMEYL